MLRERFAHRYSRTMFGMYPRSRRGETSRREGIGSGLDAAGGTISSRWSGGAKVVEADGAPLVDTEALHAMIRLFRVVQVFFLFYWKKSFNKSHSLFSIIRCLTFCSHSTRANSRGFF